MRKVCSPFFRHVRNSVRHGAQRSYSIKSTEPTVKITTLPNNIRVATEATLGHFSSVGLYIDGGSRYEWSEISGVSHFLDRMAFKVCFLYDELRVILSWMYQSTRTRTNEEMSTALHSLGGQIMCSSSRESIMYQSSHFHQATPLALSLISDTVLDPSFHPEEIEAQRDAAFYEVREIQNKPDMVLPEILHYVAYGEKGLGNSLLCPEDRIYHIDKCALRKGMKEWYRPERMVIAGAGMQHEELVELTDRYFSPLKSTGTTPSVSSRTIANSSIPTHLLNTPAPSVAKSLTRAASYLFPKVISSPAIPKSPTSTYTGGHRFVHDPQAELNHLYVAYEGVGIHDDDIYTIAVMQVLLGGGGSFSAGASRQRYNSYGSYTTLIGGPGKGMYSRLYTHILNYYPQIDHCASFHHIYSDSSLFGLFASYVPAASGLKNGNTPGQILPHLVHQLSLLLYTTISPTELNRAKNQLKSSLMMALESRTVAVEDLGRQVGRCLSHQHLKIINGG